MSEKRFDVVFFDIGGVLFDYNMNRLHNITAELADSERGAVVSALYSGRGRVYRNLWNNLENGTLPFEGFVQGVKDLLKMNGVLNRDFSVEDFREVFISPWLFGLFEGPANMVNALKKTGFILGIISNINAEHWTFLENNNPELFSKFDVKVLSFQIGRLKPEKEIWEKAMKMVGIFSNRKIAPQNCVLVDDRKDNISSAIQFGMRGIQFLAYRQKHNLAGQLAEVGVNIANKWALLEKI